MKQQMLNAASQDVAQQRCQWLAGLQKEQHNLEHEINQRTQQEVFYVARKALQDLSDVELETQITQMFIKKFEQLSLQQRQQFSTRAQGELVIRSALELSASNKKVLQQAVVQAFSAQLPLYFEVDSALVSGIEVVGSGHKLSWNIDDYLSNLEGNLAGLVNSKVEQNVRQTSGEGALSA